MSHEVQFTNTPIFDMLARQYGYERLIAGGPLQLREVKPAPKADVPTKLYGIRPSHVIVDEMADLDCATPGKSIGEDVPESLHMTPGFWKMNDEE